MLEQENLETGAASANVSPFDSFRENGYYVWKNLVPTALIDKILAAHQAEIIPPLKKQASLNAEFPSPAHS